MIILTSRLYLASSFGPLLALDIKKLILTEDKIWPDSGVCGEVTQCVQSSTVCHGLRPEEGGSAIEPLLWRRHLAPVAMCGQVCPQPGDNVLVTTVMCPSLLSLHNWDSLLASSSGGLLLPYHGIIHKTFLILSYQTFLIIFENLLTK